MEATNPETGRILCATGLSDKSIGTYRYAIQKACEDQVNLLVCHIIPQWSIKVAKRKAYFLNETRKNIVKEKASAALRRMHEQPDFVSFLGKHTRQLLRTNPLLSFKCLKIASAISVSPVTHLFNPAP